MIISPFLKKIKNNFCVGEGCTDTAGIIKNGQTCSQLVQGSNRQCYDASILSQCCASCAAVNTGISGNGLEYTCVTGYGLEYTCVTGNGLEYTGVTGNGLEYTCVTGNGLENTGVTGNGLENTCVTGNGLENTIVT